MPGWHTTWTTVTARALFCGKSLSLSTVAELRSSSSLRLIDVTGLEQVTSAPAATWPPAVSSGVPEVITQLIVWSPQLAGLIAVPGFSVHGRIVRGPTPPPARGWAVMVIVCPPDGADGADGADAQAGTALTAAMSSAPPDAARAIDVAASACLKRDTGFAPSVCPAACTSHGWAAFRVR